MRHAFLTILLVFSFLAGIAQSEDGVVYMKTKKGFVIADNTPGVYTTLFLEGVSLKDAGAKNAYFIGGDLIQLMQFPYKPAEYAVKEGESVELAALKHYRYYESDYLEKEVFKKKLKIEEKIYRNASGKQSLLWYYNMPKMKENEGAED